MSKVYFVVIYSSESEKKPIEIKRIFEKDIWEFLQENKNKLIAIYEGTCILDWS